jgi:hypothetical protein
LVIGDQPVDGQLRLDGSWRYRVDGDAGGEARRLRCKPTAKTEIAALQFWSSQPPKPAHDPDEWHCRRHALAPAALGHTAIDDNRVAHSVITPDRYLLDDLIRRPRQINLSL